MQVVINTDIGCYNLTAVITAVIPVVFKSAYMAIQWAGCIFTASVNTVKYSTKQQASQAQLCALQDHAADPPGNRAKGHGN